jgi:hypothetical protein
MPRRMTRCATSIIRGDRFLHAQTDLSRCPDARNPDGRIYGDRIRAMPDRRGSGPER